MTLSDLNKPQWDAALNAAKSLMSGNPNNADDRAAFRAAQVQLADLLPADADVRSIIQAAVRWDMLNSLVATVAMIPGAEISTIQQSTRSAGSAEQAPAGDR